MTLLRLQSVGKNTRLHRIDDERLTDSAEKRNIQRGRRMGSQVVKRRTALLEEYVPIYRLLVCVQTECLLGTRADEKLCVSFDMRNK